MYIGYINKVTRKYKIHILIGLFLFTLMLLSTAYVSSYYQRNYTNGIFELTQNTTLEGTIIQKPFPILKMEVSKGVYKDIMLVNQGKFGVENVLSEKGIQEGANVKIDGHLIYYNGQTLLEVVDINVENSQSQKHIFNNYVEIGQSSIKGEIVDPKCYFGAMKPGYGKIHRSCAIRCIEGGIPAVLVSRQNPNKEEYYVITFKNKEDNTKNLTPYIGKTVILEGLFKKGKNWSVLELSPDFKGIVINENAPSYYKEITEKPVDNVLCTSK